MGARARERVARELDPERLAGRWVDVLIAAAARARP
jgi:hypothetical protein